MNKKDILELIEEEVKHVFIDEKIELNSSNGIVSNIDLLRHKKDVLEKSLVHLSNDLINVTPHYPVDDKMKFDLTGKFVILDVNTFNKLKFFLSHE